MLLNYAILGGKNTIIGNKQERSKKLIQYYEPDHVNTWSAHCFMKLKEIMMMFTKQITGQYVIKEFILDIASWISVEFYDKCNNIIINYFVNEYKTMDKKTLQSKLMKLKKK